MQLEGLKITKKSLDWQNENGINMQKQNTVKNSKYYRFTGLAIQVVRTFVNLAQDRI